MKNTLIILSILCSIQLFGQRTIVNINSEWSYLEEPHKQPKVAATSNNWTSVDLPHSWNSLDATDLVPGYRRDASWYKKELAITQKESTKKYLLYFEGVNITSEIYVNGQMAGAHIGGYVGFEIDITQFLNSGANEILVRVDNGHNREVIPSQKSDFFIYGGITRDVWLKTVNNTYIERVKISTPDVSKSSAVANVQVTINGNLDKSSMVLVSLIGPNGKVVTKNRISVNEKIVTASLKIAKPQLWGIESPTLYSVKVDLLNDERTVVDSDNTTIGFRWFEFKEFGSFYLNGEKLLIRGTHRHEEHAGYGAAMPNELHRRDMELIKGMGANFVRLGHYSQDPEIYKACNELGIIVWDELPWCRGGLGNDQWKTNTTQLLKEMIDQNYNHPSIVFWSLGNEIYWLPDFDNGDDRTEINSYLTELNDIAHEMDPIRLTSIRKYYEGADIIDVFSPSIWSGWYSGSYENYAKALDKYLDKYPHFLHMEYGGSSHFGRHTETPITGDGFINPSGWEEAINQVEVANIAQRGDWSENYIVDLFDWHLMITESHDRFAGNAQWAFKDFATPLRPENDIPYMNQKGLTDREGNPKDAYYVFKSYWSDESFAYIESHTWTDRSGPEGLAREVNVFSNAHKVELFRSGKSLGTKTRNMKSFPACGLSWQVDFADGKNDLKAIAFDQNGNKIADDEMTVNYRFERAGAPSKLALSYETGSDGDYLITAIALDKNGLRCLEYEERVYFQCLSGGKLNESLGTPTGSSSIKMANGKASIVVKPTKAGNPVKMTVLNQSFKGSFLEFIPVVSGTTLQK